MFDQENEPWEDNVETLTRRGPEEDEMVRVYIAGPYTNGEVEKDEGVIKRNVRNATALTALMLMDGMAPYCPHLTHYIVEFAPSVTWDQWMEYDSQWLRKCHAVFRMPGVSKGADQEVREAHERGIRVFRSYEDLKEWASTVTEIDH